jgi:hypothetical protein
VALSTDYEVILISRIAEHYRRTGDNRGAVVSGVEHTGSVITSAAVIMIAVFAGFAQADLLPVKQLGVGLALAVFLDATVVRGVLVPAAMAVMGRGNWWWPGQRATMVHEGSVSIRDEKQAVGTFDGHAYCTCGADLGTVEMPTGSYQRDESRTDRIGYAADVTQTVVLERPWQKIATTVHEGGVSIRDEKQAVGALDDHASAARLADIEAAKTLASHLQQHESGPGRIHHAADVTPTVVVEVSHARNQAGI